MPSPLIIRLLACILAFTCALSSAVAAWSPTPEQRYAHNAALAEMRSRADSVADAYFDLIEAHAANAPAATLMDLENLLKTRLNAAILTKNLTASVRIAQGERMNHGTGLEEKVLAPWSARHSVQYLTTRNTLAASTVGALVLGALYAVDQAHLFPDLVFHYDNMSMYTAGGVAVISLISRLAHGDDIREDLRFHWRYQRHTLLSAFLGQLKARHIPLVPGYAITLPSMSPYFFDKLDTQNLADFLSGLTGQTGRLRLDNIYNEGRNVRGWVEHWIATLDDSIANAGTMERPVLDSIRTQWRSRLNALTDITALQQLETETRETADAIPALSAALERLGAYAFVKYENPIVRSKPGDNSVAGAITTDAISVHHSAGESSKVVFRRARIANTDLVAALTRLIPPTVSTASDTAGRVTYRTPDQPTAEPSALSDLSLGNFANSITFRVTRIQHRVTATRTRLGLHRLEAKLTVHRRDGQSVDIPVSVEFNSTQRNDRVLSYESAWIAPLNEALLNAVNALADSRVLSGADEFAHPRDLCEGAITPPPPVRVEAPADEDQNQDSAEADADVSLHK